MTTILKVKKTIKVNYEAEIKFEIDQFFVKKTDDDFCCLLRMNRKKEIDVYEKSIYIKLFDSSSEINYSTLLRE